MRDPISVCCRVERLHIAQSDQHRNPRLKEGAQARDPHNHISASTAKIEDAETKEPQKPSDLPERPHSCSGRNETFASHKPLNENRRGLPYAQGPSVANLRSLFESTPKQGLKIPRSQSLPALSRIERVHTRASEERDGAPVDRQHAIRLQPKGILQGQEKRPDIEVIIHSPAGRSRAHASEPKLSPETEQNIHNPGCEETSKNESPVKFEEHLPDPPIELGKELPVSSELVVSIRTRSQAQGQKPLQVETHFVQVKKRITEREDEESESTASRKPKRRFKTPISIQSAVVAETTKISLGDSSCTTTPRVWESKYANIDKSAFEFISEVTTPNRGSPFARLLEAQPEDHLPIQQICLKPVQFISALETFNAIIPGCNAMQRFEAMQNVLPFRCLANTKAPRDSESSKWSDRKCNYKLERANKDLIRRRLLSLNTMNIYTNSEECIKVLGMLVAEAVCVYHKELAQMLFKLRVREQLNGLTQKQDAPQEPITVVSDSKFEISWWLQRSPHGTLHYLPAYRSFSSPGSVSVVETNSVRNIARQALVMRTTLSANGLTEHDETRDGYLYVYWNRASFGHLKIGFTSKDVDERLQEWEKQCHHIAEKQYQSPQKIKHAARVEKLIHAEFANNRVSEPACQGCGKEHIEWFRNLDLALVVQRIEAWSGWIGKCPYEYRGRAWRLKEDPEFELPLPPTIRTEEPETPKKPRSPRPKSSSPRQSFRSQRVREESPSPQPRTRPSSLFTFLAAQIDPALSASNAIHTVSAPLLT